MRAILGSSLNISRIFQGTQKFSFECEENLPVMGGRENMQIDRNFKIWLGFWTWWGWCDILFINILGIDLRKGFVEGGFGTRHCTNCVWLYNLEPILSPLPWSGEALEKVEWLHVNFSMEDLSSSCLHPNNQLYHLHMVIRYIIIELIVEISILIHAFKLLVVPNFEHCSHWIFFIEIFLIPYMWTKLLSQDHCTFMHASWWKAWVIKQEKNQLWCL